MKPADEMLEDERRLMELVGRVFAAADPRDVEDFLRRFAAYTGAFDHRAIGDATTRDIMLGRRQAFFWIADHLQLDLANCWPRYLTPVNPPR